MYKCFVQRTDRFWLWVGRPRVPSAGSSKPRVALPRLGRLFYVHGNLPVSWLMGLLARFLFMPFYALPLKSKGTSLLSFFSH